LTLNGFCQHKPLLVQLLGQTIQPVLFLLMCRVACVCWQLWLRRCWRQWRLHTKLCTTMS
jgi:hypothetical protein